ncbi:MAG: PEGA domain-containing protein [Myxococcales bacterium]|nr:PEGA domain-containing protein [Myxococcales bacterium]
MLPALPAALLLFASAAPGPGRLAVVEVGSPPTMIGLAGQITEALLAEARAQRYELVEPAAIRARLGEKDYGDLQGCGGSPSCVAARLGGIAADRVAIGALNRDEKNYQVRLWLLDMRELKVISEVDRSILIASRRLMKDVTSAIPALLRGEREALGTLKLTSNVQGAQVTLDGESTGTAPLEVRLKPGKHQVKLEKKAYMPVERLVTVEPNQIAQVEVRLLVRPGETPEEEVVPPIAAATVPKEGAGQGLRVPQNAWLAGGVALAALGAGGFFGVSSWTTERKLLSGFDPERNVYQGTRREALAAKRGATVANVSFAVAGAALAAGVVFTLLDSGTTASVTPAAGPAGAGVELRGRF